MAKSMTATISHPRQGHAGGRINGVTDTRPPLPPFTLATAIEKVQAAEDAWNSRDPDLVSGAYTVDSQVC
jgi:hypothetical protein